MLEGGGGTAVARILVVDDDQGFREFAADLLQLEGHEVAQASDGDEALVLLRKRGFHVLLTDLKMRRMDGMTLLKRMREEQPELEVLVMTAHGTVSNAVQAMQLGAFHYLQKPLESPDELLLQVNRAYERRALKDSQQGAKAASLGGTPLTWGAPSMVPVVDALRRVARTEATVLLLGESGVGKEVAARALHEQSTRAQGPFIAVNCAALSQELLESELFGHEKGAFTGAVAQRRGKLELADGGTFFLDEVGELKLELQARLLRVLQEKRFERVGGERTITTDVRWIAATNRELASMIEAGTFRKDLYHRLALFPLRIPALRERREDILPLAQRLLQRIGRSLGRSDLQLAPGLAQAIQAEPWHGNVRELANTLERAAILSDGPVLEAHALVLPSHTPRSPLVSPSRALASDPSAAPSFSPPGLSPGADVTPTLKPLVRTLEEVEKEAIREALDRIGNRRLAAEALGIGLRTLYDKLSKYGLL